MATYTGLQFFRGHSVVSLCQSRKLKAASCCGHSDVIDCACHVISIHQRA